MQEQEPLAGPERELAAALGDLEPAAMNESMRTIWYEAGIQAGRRRATAAWGAVAASIAIVAVGGSFWSRAHFMASPTERIVYVHDAPDHPPALLAADTPMDPRITASNLELRDRLLNEGWAALPASGDGDARPLPRAGPLDRPTDTVLPQS